MFRVSNVILIGITGVGKTTIGKQLADKVKKPFIDLDKYIELTYGVDIPTIFELEGEKGFRDREAQALLQAMNEHEEYVLSLGGGCVIRPENRQALLRDNSVTVQLAADLDTITERLINSPNKRPLLQNQDIKAKIQELYNARRPMYDSVSDFTISTDDLRPAQVVDEIIKQVTKK